MRKFFRFVMMALVLVTVSVMSGLTAMRIAIHGRETTVPNFAKLSSSEAERLALTNGLQVVLEGQFYSTEVPEGRIVSQMPMAGTRVRRGWRVRLAQSLGPQRVVIPDLLGQSPRAAEINVRQRGLELGPIAEINLPDSPSLEVLAQSPPPLAKNVESPKISVLVATEKPAPTFVMPNFVGRPLQEASIRIEKAGLKLRTSAMGAPPTSAAGLLVIRQHPAPGQRITSDTLIELETSTSAPTPPGT
jgi:beta-lactam-binding protein with PASTA domain